MDQLGAITLPESITRYSDKFAEYMPRGENAKYFTLATNVLIPAGVGYLVFKDKKKKQRAAMIGAAIGLAFWAYNQYGAK